MVKLISFCAFMTLFYFVLTAAVDGYVAYRAPQLDTMGAAKAAQVQQQAMDLISKAMK